MLYIVSPRLIGQEKLCDFGIDGAVEHLLWNVELCNCVTEMGFAEF